MAKAHIVFLTEEEIKALLNLARISMDGYKDNEYVQNFAVNGGKSGRDKLIEKILEINRDADRQ